MSEILLKTDDAGESRLGNICKKKNSIVDLNWERKRYAKQSGGGTQWVWPHLWSEKADQHVGY